MEKLVSMKKLVSLGLVFVLAAVFAISAFAAPADAEEIVPLSRGSYYLTSGYTTIASVSTGLGTSSIEVYNNRQKAGIGLPAFCHYVCCFAGNTKQKEVPPPGVSCTVKEPCCRLANSVATVSPNP